MRLKRAPRKQNFPIDIDLVAGLTVKTQKQNGEIPRRDGEKPYLRDHVDVATWLTTGGHLEEALRASELLA